MENEEKFAFLADVAESFERSLNRMSGSMYVMQIVLKELYEAASPEAKTAAELKLLAININRKEPNKDFSEGVLTQTRVFSSMI